MSIISTIIELILSPRPEDNDWLQDMFSQLGRTINKTKKELSDEDKLKLLNKIGENIVSQFNKTCRRDLSVKEYAKLATATLIAEEVILFDEAA